MAGPLDAVADELLANLEQLRTANGWLMDTYLLRRRRAGDE